LPATKSYMDTRGYPRGCRKRSSCVPWPRRLKRLLLVKMCSKTQSSYAGASFAHLLRVNCASARISALPGNTIQPFTTPSVGYRKRSLTGTQEPGGTNPCGCIQPMRNDTTSSTNSAIDNTIRMVRNFTVRFVSPRSLIRLTMPAPRLMSISANRSKTIIFMIISDVE
jgi:hypothetical protein